MSTLYIDRKDIELRADGGALAFYEAGKRRGTVPFNTIERVVIRAAARLDTRVLGVLAEQGIGLIVLTPRHGRRSAFLLGLPHNDVTRRLSQYEAYLDAECRLAWSRQLIAGKLQAQRRLLDRALTTRADLRKPLTDGIARLDRALERVGPDAAVTDLAELRGLEGAAAAAYFAAFTKVFPPSLNFSSRNRRPPRDPVNACLSLGYTLLHFDAVHACHAAGLDVLLGLYHEPAFGRESLATDMIEPLRAHVDECVWTLFRERILTADHFRDDKGACLLAKAGRQHFYKHYEALGKGVRRLLRREAFKLARAFAVNHRGLSEVEA